MKSNKLLAVNLRLEGWSYGVIGEKLGVAKSTLSNWLKDVPYTPNQETMDRIHEGPSKSVVVRHNMRMDTITAANNQGFSDIGVLSERDLFMLGLGIYIGEGTKAFEDIRIVNSDPDVIRIAIRWFRDICGVSIENFCALIHIYPDISDLDAKQYWSEITGIPINRFAKTYVDIRTNKNPSRRRRLPYGTLHLTVLSRGNPKNGVLLHRKIMGWIRAVYAQLRV